jgi:hypothetical protein
MLLSAKATHPELHGRHAFLVPAHATSITTSRMPLYHTHHTYPGRQQIMHKVPQAPPIDADRQHVFVEPILRRISVDIEYCRVLAVKVESIQA